MIESLIEELAAVGLVMNAKKTKILHTAFNDDRNDVDYVEIAGDLVHILHPDQVHRYLGRHLNLDDGVRIGEEMTYRRKQAWFIFNKHERVLLDNHVSLGKRLQYFDTCVTPAALYVLSVFPLRRSELDVLDILQRKMLRRIVGWRRIDSESWHDTMDRMNQRLLHGQSLHACEDWSTLVLRQQWRYTFHLIYSSPNL